MIQDLRPDAKFPLAFLQARAHPLQLRHDRLPRLFGRHASWDRTFRRFSSSRQIPEIHHQQRGQPIFKRGASRQWSALFQTFPQSAVGVLVSKEKVLQNLPGVPFFGRSLSQIANFRAANRIFEFAPQAFEIGIHDAK